MGDLEFSDLGLEQRIRIEALRLANSTTYLMGQPLYFDGGDAETLGRYGPRLGDQPGRTAADAARLNERAADLEAAVVARDLRTAERMRAYIETGATAEPSLEDAAAAWAAESAS